MSEDSVGWFFFQAEDGIRDIGVTGVQACALPISRAVRAGAATAARMILVIVCQSPCVLRTKRARRRGGGSTAWPSPSARAAGGSRDRRGRKSVVQGKRVELRGGRIIK